MTVKELKDAIKDLPDNMEVVLSRDPEGNGFNSLFQVDVVDLEELEMDGEGKAALLWP